MKLFVVSALLGMMCLPAPARAADPKGEVKLGGRLFSRAELERIDGDEAIVGAKVQSLRLEADWRWRYLRAVGEVELARGEAQVRDAFLRFRATPNGGRLDLSFGRTKAPFSRFNLESAFVLPIARRGLLTDTLRDRALLGGRTTGMHVDVRTKYRFAPAASLAITQAEDVADRRIPDAGKVAGRLEATFGPVELGVAAEARQAIARPEIGVGTWAAFEADAAIERKMFDLTWRGWAEATLGKTWIDQVPTDGDDAWLVAAQVLVAARIDGERAGKAYVEAFAFFQVLEPDTGVVADVAWEAGGGLNAGYWKRARLQLQVERWSADRNTPAGYGLVDQTVVLGQAAVAF